MFLKAISIAALSRMPIEYKSPIDGDSTNAVAEWESADRDSGPGETMNIELPRVLSCLFQASAALSAKRIDDLCIHLEQASAILKEAILAVIPNAEEETTAQSEAESTAPVEEGMPIDAPPEVPVVTTPEFEHRRVMAVAA
jgi:hypothetical protein